MGRVNDIFDTRTQVTNTFGMLGEISRKYARSVCYATFDAYIRYVYNKMSVAFEKYLTYEESVYVYCVGLLVCGKCKAG